MTQEVAAQLQFVAMKKPKKNQPVGLILLQCNWAGLIWFSFNLNQDN